MELMVPSLFLYGILSRCTLWTFFVPGVLFQSFCRVSLLLTYALLCCFSRTPIHTHAHTAPFRSLDFHSDPPVHKPMVSSVQRLCFKESLQLQLSSRE